MAIFEFERHFGGFGIFVIFWAIFGVFDPFWNFKVNLKSCSVWIYGHVNIWNHFTRFKNDPVFSTMFGNFSIVFGCFWSIFAVLWAVLNCKDSLVFLDTLFKKFWVIFVGFGLISRFEVKVSLQQVWFWTPTGHFDSFGPFLTPFFSFYKYHDDIFRPFLVFFDDFGYAITFWQFLNIYGTIWTFASCFFNDYGSF